MSQSSAYHNYINSMKWRLKRIEAFRHYGRKCSRCGSARRLEVHHVTYIDFGNEPMEALAVLCVHCHRDEHGLPPLRSKKRKPKPEKRVVIPQDSISHHEWVARKKLAEKNIRRHYETDAFIPSNM